MSKDSSDSDRPDSPTADEGRAQSPAEPETRYDVKVDAHETAATRARNSTPRVLDEISRKSGGAARQSSAGRSARSRPERRTGLRLFTLLLFLYTLGATGFLAWQQQLLQDNLAGIRQRNINTDSDLGNEIASLNAALAELRSQVEEEGRPALADPDSPGPDSSTPGPATPGPATPDPATPAPSTPDPGATDGLRERQEALVAEIDSLRDALSQLQSDQASAGAPPDFAWKVFEAEYLTSFAAQKLALEADYGAAIGLLQRADQALVDSGNSEVLGAREALSADIAALRDIEQPDYEELYLQLENLAATAQELNMQEAMRQRFAARREQLSEPLVEDAAQPGALGATMDFLGQVFIWRKWQDRPEATLAPGEDLLVRQNLELAIKRAQVGLVNRDPASYRAGLEEAREILEDYQLSEAQGGRVVMNEIDSLMSEDIAPQPPSLQRSLQAVGELAATER